MAEKTIKLHAFRRLVRTFDCSLRKTTKEWEVIDDTDGEWVSSFATVSGRSVKVSYVRHFLKQIEQKRKTVID